MLLRDEGGVRGGQLGVHEEKEVSGSIGEGCLDFLKRFLARRAILGGGGRGEGDQMEAGEETRWGLVCVGWGVVSFQQSLGDVAIMGPRRALCSGRSLPCDSRGASTPFNSRGVFCQVCSALFTLIRLVCRVIVVPWCGSRSRLVPLPKLCSGILSLLHAIFPPSHPLPRRAFAVA